MIAIVRIKGQINLRGDATENLKRLRLLRKYVCVILPENKINNGMIMKARNEVAYGKATEETIKKLIELRGELIDKTKKTDKKKAAEEFLKGKLKLQELNIKPFFRLHPPRGGIDSKLHIGVKKGVLGDHKEGINKLIERML